MAKKKKVEEEESYLNYIINVNDGGKMILKAKKMKVMSGQPSPPPNPPKG
jgi:hypothetical protein